MSRYKYQATAQDGTGRFIPSATVTVYLANSTTLATIYAAASGGSAVSASAVTSNSTTGWFEFYVDDSEYMPNQLFKIILSKTGYTSQTWDYLKIIPDETYKYFVDASATDQAAATTRADRTVKDFIDSVGGTKKATLVFSHSGTGNTTTYTFSNDETVTSNFVFEIHNGAVLSIANTKTLTMNAEIEAGDYQLLDGAGGITFADGSTVKSAWWSTFEIALTKISTAKVRLIVSAAASVAGDATVNANTTLCVPSAGRLLTVADTKTLTVSGLIDAGAYQIFAVAGSGAVDYTGVNGVWHNEWESGGSGTKIPDTLELISGTTINEFSTDGTAAGNSDTAVMTEKAIVTYVQLGYATSIPGFLQRTQMTYSDTDTITLTPAVYHHQGTTEQLVYWDATLTYDFGSAGSNALSDDLGASQWHYLYIDDSAVVTAATNVISATQLVNDTTAPSWNDAKHGFYNGNDRCIGFVLTNGASQILLFYHANGLIQFDVEIASDVSGTDIDNVWADCTVVAPNLGDNLMVLATFVGSFGTTSGGLIEWRKNGSSSAGNRAVYVDSGEVGPINTIVVVLDTTQKIEVIMANASDTTMSVLTQGIYLPIGM